MDEAMLKSGQFPNVAILAGTDPKEVMREHGKVIQNAEKYELADSREQLLNGICGTKSEKTPEIARQDGVLNISDVQDTREQLEADAMFDAKMLWNSADECISVIRGWLDRQAAITERKCMKQATTRYIGWDCAECAEGLGKELDARCDPLKERIAELTAEVEKHRQRANDAERGVLSDEWYVARDRYEDDIAELTAERDHFRKHVNHLMALIADIARKQPYTFDPEAPYMTLDTIGDYLDELQDRVDSLTAERDQLDRDLDAEHAMVVQFEHDNEELRHANNTLRASVAGLKMTVDKLKAADGQKHSHMGN